MDFNILGLIRRFRILVFGISWLGDTYGMMGNRKYVELLSVSNAVISLGDYCLKPSAEQNMVIEIKALQDAHVNLMTDAGLTSYHYQFVIGGTSNTRVFIRKRSPSSIGHKKHITLPPILSNTTYRPFWIGWEGGHVRVGYGFVPDIDTILTWDDTEPLNITGISFASYYTDLYLIAYFPEVHHSSFYKHPSTRSLTTVLARITGSLDECVVECFINIRCNSMNYETETKTCELLQSAKSAAIGASMFDFYTMC